MSIKIGGNNYGLAIEGDVSIEELEFEFGRGLVSARGIKRVNKPAEEPEEAEVIPAEEAPEDHSQEAKEDHSQEAEVIPSTIPPAVLRGLKAVLDSELMQYAYYWTAIWAIINQKNLYHGHISLRTFSKVLEQSGLFTPEKLPKYSSMTRVSIRDNYPNWKIDKGGTDYIAMNRAAGIFLQACGLQQG